MHTKRPPYPLGLNVPTVSSVRNALEGPRSFVGHRTVNSPSNLEEPVTSNESGTGASMYGNDEEFKQPHWLIRARGFNVKKWYEENEVVGTGGINLPKEAKLRTGQYLYRFASSETSIDTKLGGGWWLEFEEFKKIENFANDNGYRLKDAARNMLALPYDWSKVDLLVRALLIVPLRAYRGYGKVAKGGDGAADKGTLYIPTQHIKIYQLYIPGLYIHVEPPDPPRRPPHLYSKVFEKSPEISPLR